MATIDKIPLPEYINGTVREAAVDEAFASNDTVELALNLHFDRVGALELRKGITTLGDEIVASTPILGLGNYVNNAGTTRRALAKIGTFVYAYNGSSWSAVRTGLTSSSKARFTSFVDYIFMVNGNGSEVCATWAGSGLFGSTNVASLPKGDYIENYRSRIWVADKSTDKSYYSDVVTTTGTITGGTSFIQVSPQDGETITGLKRSPKALLVFKNNHIYRIFSVTSADPDPTIFRGTYSHESIVEGKDGISYHHSSGFYNFVFEGEQEEISRPIIDIVQAIARASYEDVVGWADDDHKYWFVGDVTLAGVSFTNIVCRYTISTQVWTVFSYAKEFRSAVIYDDGTDLIQLVGGDNGKVYQFDTGITDDSTPIGYDMITHPYYFTDVKSVLKTLEAIAIVHEKATGSEVLYQTDSMRSNEWKPVGAVNQELWQKMNIGAKDFTKIRFRVKGSSVGSPFIIRGLEAVSLITEGVVKKYH